MSFTFNGAKTKKIYIAFGEKESDVLQSMILSATCTRFVAMLK